MDTICAEQHNFHHSQQLLSPKKSLLCRDIDIPPRKLLSRRSTSITHQDQNPDMFSDSPIFSSADESLLQKFLSFNEDDDDSDPYSSDHFRMYEFKVRRCTRSRSHDWTDCPFSHPGEKARRRDPRKYHYSGTVCPHYRRGGCSRGDSCEFSHGVFECWLHPARYRTEACKDGKNCKRKVCFFAHTPRQLRILPPPSSPEVVSPNMVSNKKANYLSSVSSSVCSNSPPHRHCCLFCHHPSPTSTLLGMSHLSPPMSPPLSPANNKHIGSLNGPSPISRYSGEKHHFSAPNSNGFDQLHAIGKGSSSYKDSLTDLMISSLEAMNFNEINSPNSPISASSISAHSSNSNVPPNWVDVSFNGDDQQQFILSPSTPNPSGSINFFSRDGPRRSSSVFQDQNKLNNDNGGSGMDPDLGWVNELLK